MEGEDIDRPALPMNVEGHLRGDFPGRIAQEPQDRVGEIGMRGIEEPIERLAVPQDPHVQGGTQSARDADERPYSDRLGATAFDPRDGRSRQADHPGESLLGQPPATAQSP